MTEVVVIDYGLGNLKSVQRGIEKAGGSVILSNDPEVIATADRCVLPGVGAFSDGMAGLEQAGVRAALDEFVKRGNPLLGICLGMQMLATQSEEFGFHHGLGYIPGTVTKIPRIDDKGNLVRKIPNVSWCALKPNGESSWEGTVLGGTEAGRYFYFVHSFMVATNTREHSIAAYNYEGMSVTAAIASDNVIGVQFHPEKSGAEGLNLLQTFLNL